MRQYFERAGFMFAGLLLGWLAFSADVNKVRDSYQYGYRMGQSDSRVEGLDRFYAGLSRTIEWCEQAGFEHPDRRQMTDKDGGSDVG